MRKTNCNMYVCKWVCITCNTYDKKKLFKIYSDFLIYLHNVSLQMNMILRRLISV